MINIRLADNYASVYSEYHGKSITHLLNKDSVENEYKRIIEWDSKAFKDEMSKVNPFVKTFFLKN